MTTHSDLTPGSSFRAPGTFMSLPTREQVPRPDVALFGIPFDVGTHPGRIGARQGPDHIRHQSQLTRRYLADRVGDPIGVMRISDWGNVDLIPGRPEAMLEPATAAVERILETGAIPLAMGGDGTITLPVLRALHQTHGALAVVHFDAHTDTYPVPPNERLTTATTFTCAVEEGLVDPARSIHLGVRGTSFLPDVTAHARELGFVVMTCEDLVAAGPTNIATLVGQRVAHTPTYLCWDMDFYDPAAAPGVATPEWGGLSAREGLGFLRGLDGLSLIGADVGTVSPPHDLAGMTGSLAARTVLEILFLIASTAARK
jgi:agmatinase